MGERSNTNNDVHLGTADDLESVQSHPKMADAKLGQSMYCLLNCFYNTFYTKQHWYDKNVFKFAQKSQLTTEKFI